MTERLDTSVRSRGRWERCGRVRRRRRDTPFLHDERIADRQYDAEHCHAGKRCTPAEVRGDESAEGNAEHRSDHAAGQKGAADRGAHASRKHREQHRQADAAVGCFADADDEPCGKHLLVILRKCAGKRRDTPQRGHEHQAADPAPAIGEQRQRKGQRPDRQRHDPTERAQTRIGERPLRLQQRKHGIQHLPRHVVGEQQAEGHREHQPRVAAGGVDSPACAALGVGLS